MTTENRRATLVCKQCGVEFDVVLSKAKTRKYCSRECWLKSKKAKRVKLITLTCEQCGKKFDVIPSDKNRKFCSVKCYRNSSCVKLVCEQCGKIFIRRRGDIEKNNKYFCSAKCSDESRKKRVVVNCERCRKEFEAPLSKVALGYGRFCSRKCAGKAKRKQVKLVCRICNKEFSVRLSVANGVRKYCSNKCRYRAVGKNRYKSGERRDLPGIRFRSSWEANYARILNLWVSSGKISKWEYEPDILEIGDIIYIPDFQVFYNNISEYHEVKGYKRKRSMEKISMAIDAGFPIILIDLKVYKNLEKEYRHMIPNWEYRKNGKQ